jgi:hypothetical protein
MPAQPAEPVELDHALRHIAAARAEWSAGTMEMARMHLREAICDTAWCLYAATVAELDLDERLGRPRPSGDAPPRPA